MCSPGLSLTSSPPPQYLWEPRDSYVFMAVQTSPPPQEVFHPVSVMAEDPPSELPPTATGLNVTGHGESTGGETVNWGRAGRKEGERIAEEARTVIQV